jgi:hypothetical protein
VFNKGQTSTERLVNRLFSPPEQHYHNKSNAATSTKPQSHNEQQASNAIGRGNTLLCTCGDGWRDREIPVHSFVCSCVLNTAQASNLQSPPPDQRDQSNLNSLTIDRWRANLKRPTHPSRLLCAVVRSNHHGSHTYDGVVLGACRDQVWGEGALIW